MKNELLKYCSICGNKQLYNSMYTYKRAIKEKSFCNSCSSTHQKKVLCDDIINDVVKLYRSNLSLTKISKSVNISRIIIKRVLIEKKVYVEGKNSLKKDLPENDIIVFYNNGLSLQKISNIYKVSKEPIKRIIKNNGLLRKGLSNGSKINISDFKKSSIKTLYLNEFKNYKEISNIVGLTSSLVNKYLIDCGYRRSRSESISINKKGKPLSDSVKEKIRISNKKYAISGKRIQKGGICKFFQVNGIKCQGTYEKFYIENLLKKNEELPINSKIINTPFGGYTPDFTYNNKYVEIKSDFTYDVLIGVKSYWFTKKIDITQYKKIKWVNENILPVEIIVVDKKNNKFIKKEIK